MFRVSIMTAQGGCDKWMSVIGRLCTEKECRESC